MVALVVVVDDGAVFDGCARLRSSQASQQYLYAPFTDLEDMQRVHKLLGALTQVQLLTIVAPQEESHGVLGGARGGHPGSHASPPRVTPAALPRWRPCQLALGPFRSVRQLKVKGPEVQLAAGAALLPLRPTLEALVLEQCMGPGCDLAALLFPDYLQMKRRARRPEGRAKEPVNNKDNNNDDHDDHDDHENTDGDGSGGEGGDKYVWMRLHLLHAPGNRLREMQMSELAVVMPALQTLWLEHNAITLQDAALSSRTIRDVSYPSRRSVKEAGSSCEAPKPTIEEMTSRYSSMMGMKNVADNAGSSVAGICPSCATSVRSLNLHANRLTELPPNLSMYLPALTSVVLTSNLLRKIRPLCSLQNLKEANLAANLICQLQEVRSIAHRAVNEMSPLHVSLIDRLSSCL